MSFRRRHRWLRRLALALAVAVVVAVSGASLAYAKGAAGAPGAVYVTTPGWSGLVDEESGIPLAAGITDDLWSPGLAVVGEPAASKAVAGSSPVPLSDSSVRPDDEAARFAHPSGAAQPQAASRATWTFERSDALILGVGTVVLGLGLGLALGSLGRPRIAGL
jgi:hypothetical protein